MKQRRYKRRKPPLSEINVVPYIDVMLVLLVIFMITAPLLAQGVKVKLPEAKAKVIDAKGKEPIVVSVDQEGHYYLNVADDPEAAMPPAKLALRVAAYVNLDKQRPVLINGDRAVSYGAVVKAMVLLQRAGVDAVGLVTSSESVKQEG